MTTIPAIYTLDDPHELDWRGGRTLAADGTSLSRLTVGTGPAVLIVPGGLADAASWAHIARALADSYQVTVMDRRNAGASGWSDLVGVTIEAHDVIAVLDDIGPAAVLAHSYGAAVALEAAASAGSQISSLVLYEPPLALGGPVIADQTLDHWAALTVCGLSARVLSELFAPPVSVLQSISPVELEQLRASPIFDSMWAAQAAAAPVIEPSLRSLNDLDDPDRYSRVTVPTRVLLGSDSAAHPFRDTAEILARTMADATVVELPGQRHLAAVLAPDLLVGAVREFVPS